jgi:hypothetical protein
MACGKPLLSSTHLPHKHKTARPGTEKALQNGPLVHPATSSGGRQDVTAPAAMAKATIIASGLSAHGRWASISCEGGGAGAGLLGPGAGRGGRVAVDQAGQAPAKQRPPAGGHETAAAQREQQRCVAARLGCARKPREPPRTSSSSSSTLATGVCCRSSSICTCTWSRSGSCCRALGHDDRVAAHVHTATSAVSTRAAVSQQQQQQQRTLWQHLHPQLGTLRQQLRAGRACTPHWRSICPLCLAHTGCCSSPPPPHHHHTHNTCDTPHAKQEQDLQAPRAVGHQEEARRQVPHHAQEGGGRGGHAHQGAPLLPSR